MTVYTDGACRGNPGPGGWAWAVPGGRFESGADPATTNQRMEIMAALEALGSLTKEGVRHHFGGQRLDLCRQLLQGPLVARLAAPNWLNSQKKPVANRDLWEPLIELALSSEADVRWRWVKGHSGDRWNDRVDELATLAADRGGGERVGERRSLSYNCQLHQAHREKGVNQPGATRRHPGRIDRCWHHDTPAPPFGVVWGGTTGVAGGQKEGTTVSAEDEFDIVVIGGGPGGYATALYGAAAGLPLPSSNATRSVGPACTVGVCRPRNFSRPPR